MIETSNLLKRNAFYKTLEILSNKGNSMTLRKFCEQLYGEKDSYNTFFRIRDKMLSTGLISLYYEKSSRIKKIKLTEKGILVKQTLKILMELIG